jgi:hypothetical protein
MKGGSYRFKGYGASVRVDAPAGVTLTDLERQVAPEVTAEEWEVGPSDLHLTRWNGEYHLLYGERRYGPYRTLDNALRGVSNGIHFILGKRSPMTFLHAGAVEIDGCAIVFPGRSRWGKSMLVASLVDQGCGYLSDEYAVVSSEGSVLPLSKPIRLRMEDGESLIDVNRPGARAPGGFRCAAVILTRYEDGASWQPQILTAGQAVMETLATALKSRDEPDQVLPAIAAMIEGAACWQGARGGEEPTASMIRALLERESSSQEARA